MKNTLLAITLVSFTALAMGCKPSDENSQKTTSEQLDTIKKETKEVAQNVKEYSFAQKAEFTKQMKSDLVAINADLDHLADRIEKSSEAAQADAKPKLKALRDQTAQLDKQLDDVENATESTWDSVKSGARKALDSIKDGFQDSRKWLSEKVAP